MIRIWTLYLIIIFPAFNFAQNHPDGFDHKKDSLMPGTSTSVSFIVDNKSSENRMYTVDIKSSNPFIVPLLSDAEIRIPAKDKLVYLVPLKIAPEVPQGKYSVVLHATEHSTGENIILESKFQIAAKRKLLVTTLDSPEFVKAGESIKASFLLKNSGNTDENLVLESKNAIVDQEASLILAPGETKVITISKKTSAELEKNEYLNLNLSVISPDYPEQNQSIYTSVKLIAVKPGEEDIYHRFPVSASLSFVGMKNRGHYQDGFQGEFYGKGSLGKDNQDILEFHAVTKNPVEFNSFTPYEEYFVNYKRDNLMIHLGDKAYSSSYLTEFARYGRGAEIRFDLEKISFGGFYNHPRFFRDIKDEFNLYSKFRFNKESEITAGYLYKIPRNETHAVSLSNLTLHSAAHLPYLSGKSKLTKNITITGEASYSKTKNAVGHAYMLQTQVNFNTINGSLMYMKSSPEFAGYFNNTGTFNGNIQYRIFKKLNIIANYMQDARNFQRDTLYLAAPYRKFLQYGFQYQYADKGNFMLYNGFQKYEDRLEPKQFNYFERFFRFTIDQQLGIFQLNFEGQFGKTENYLSGFTGRSSFYTANIGFEKFKTSFNLYASYANTSRYQMLNQKQTYYGARIISRFSEKTSFSVFYQNNYMPEDYYSDRNLFELLFHQQIYPGHEIDLSGRYTLQRGDLGNKDFIFSLKYILRLHVPVKKTAEYTSLSGNIKNLGVKKVDGIRLMLGNYLSVTDHHGNFVFKNIVPGEYYLEIDRETTGIHDIADVSLPVQLNLNNKINVFNFGLTNAATIKGQIRLVENTNQTSFAKLPAKKEKNKKESIIIEAYNGEQTFRKIVPMNTHFDFTYLRPGKWTVKIYRNGLDKRYKISADQFEFTLHSSEIKNVSIDVIKQPNEIKYQQETIKVGYNESKKRR